MAGDTSFNDYVMELLSPLGEVTSRAMFGGYGIFHQGVMFALISGSTLYFKVNDSNRADYENAGSKPFPHNMPYYEVPADVLEDTAILHEWATTAIAVGHATAKKKRRSPPPPHCPSYVGCAIFNGKWQLTLSSSPGAPLPHQVGFRPVLPMPA